MIQYIVLRWVEDLLFFFPPLANTWYSKNHSINSQGYFFFRSTDQLLNARFQLAKTLSSRYSIPAKIAKRIVQASIAIAPNSRNERSMDGSWMTIQKSEYWSRQRQLAWEWTFLMSKTLWTWGSEHSRDQCHYVQHFNDDLSRAAMATDSLVAADSTVLDPSPEEQGKGPHPLISP